MKKKLTILNLFFSIVFYGQFNLFPLIPIDSPNSNVNVNPDTSYTLKPQFPYTGNNNFIFYNYTTSGGNNYFWRFNTYGLNDNFEFTEFTNVSISNTSIFQSTSSRCKIGYYNTYDDANNNVNSINNIQRIIYPPSGRLISTYNSTNNTNSVINDYTYPITTYSYTWSIAVNVDTTTTFANNYQSFNPSEFPVIIAGITFNNTSNNSNPANLQQILTLSGTPNTSNTDCNCIKFKIRITRNYNDTTRQPGYQWESSLSDLESYIEYSTLSSPFFSAHKFSIYPNPTRSLINIQPSNNVVLDKISITDLTGKIVMEQTQNTNQINVEKLSSGVYIINAYSEGEKYQEKFIKE